MTDVQEFGGIYDGGSMSGVEHAWNKAKASQGVSQRIKVQA